MYQLYSNQNSGHSYKVALMLEINSAPFELINVSLVEPKASRDASFMERSAFGEVPVLVHDNNTLCQSNHILLYLAKNLDMMGGHTPDEQRKVREWLFWEANRIGFSVPNLRYYTKFFPDFPDENREFLVRRVVADLKTLSRYLQDRAFLVGDTLTIADLSCCGYLYWLDEAGVDISEFPHVKDWLGRISTTPGWHAPYLLLAPQSGKSKTRLSL